MQGIATRVRQRPVDNFRRLVIYRDASELQFDDDAEAELSQAKKKRMIDLPIPTVSEVSDYTSFTSGGYVPPLGYNRRRVRCEERGGEGCADAFPSPLLSSPEWIEYDADGEDMAWISTISRFGSAGSLTLGLMERMIDDLEHASGRIAPGHAVSASEGVQELLRCLADTSVSKPAAPAGMSMQQVAKMCEEVYNYWSAKRAKLKKPLLRRYWTPTPLADNDPHRVFRPHEKNTYRLRRTRRNDLDSYNRLWNLRTDLLSARSIIDLIRMRESLKKDLVSVSQDILEQAIDNETNLSGKPRVPKTLEERAKKKEASRLKLRLMPSISAAGQQARRSLPVADDAASYADTGDENEEDQDGYAGRPRTAAPKARQQTVKQPSKKENVQPAQAQKKWKAGGPPAPQVAPAAGVAVPGSQSTYYPFGLNPQAAVPGAGATANQVTFYPGYHGLRLGPWSLPRTVPPHHLEEAFFEHEDTLGMGPAIGLRLGVPATPNQVDAAVRALAYTVLPSGSHAFPMDHGYVIPEDPEVNRADATVQRRMLIARQLNAIPGMGGISWEQGSGSGLVAGVGSGFGVDGRGWESVGARLESAVQPLDDVYGATTDALGYIPPEKKDRSTAVEANGSDEDTSVDDEQAAFQRLLLTGDDEERALNEAKVLQRLRMDKKWIEEYLSDYAIEASKDHQQTDAGTAAPVYAAPKRKRSRPEFVLRPRISRGGRVVLDRIRINRPNLQRQLTAAIPALDARVALVERDKRRAWRQLMGESGLSNAQLASVLQKVTGITCSSLPSAESLDLLSTYELREASGFEGTALDPHAVHIAQFSHYTTAGSSAVVSSMEKHQEHIDGCGQRAAYVRATVHTIRGLSSSFLAPSKFTRMGDEMLAVKQYSEMLAAVAHKHTPVDSRRATEDSTLLFPPEFDAFYDDPANEMEAYAAKQKRKAMPALLNTLFGGKRGGDDDAFDLMNLRDLVDASIDEEYGIDDTDDPESIDDAEPLERPKQPKRFKPLDTQQLPILDQMTHFERDKLTNPVFQDVFAEFSRDHLPGLAAYIDEVSRSYVNKEPEAEISTASVVDQTLHAYALPDGFAVPKTNTMNTVGTVAFPFNARPVIPATVWLQEKGVPIEGTADSKDGSAPQSDITADEELQELMGSVPRDKYGIPILGAHTCSDTAKQRVKAASGATMKIPNAALAICLTELFGKTSTAHITALSHATGVVPAGQLPAPVALVSQQPSRRLDAERFAELWRRDGPTDLDELMAQSAFSETGMRGEMLKHTIAHSFEDAQLAPFLEQLEADKGT